MIRYKQNNVIKKYKLHTHEEREAAFLFTGIVNKHFFILLTIIGTIVQGPGNSKQQKQRKKERI